LDRVKELYGAFAFSANFTNSATTGQINDYVKKQTYGQITDCLQEFSQDTLMVLLNYIFFKGEAFSVLPSSASKRSHCRRRPAGLSNLVRLCEPPGNFMSNSQALVA
jgi:serine protease inhibitor